MTNKIIAILQNAGLVNQDNDKIILLGVRRISAALLDIFIAMVWSFVLGDIVVGIFFELFYCVLRIYAGGYHASSERMCKFLTYTSTLAGILIIFVCNINKIFMHAVLVLLVCFVITNAPIENENKRLNKTEKKVYWKYCLVILITEIGLYTLFVLFQKIIYARAIWVAILLVTMGMIGEKIKSHNLDLTG